MAWNKQQVTNEGRFTLELKIKANPKDGAFLNKVFRLCNQVYNRMVSHCRKQIRKLRMDPAYRQAMADYTEAKKSGDSTALADAQTALNERIVEYGLTEAALQSYVKVQQYRYAGYIDSHVAQKLASRVYQSAASVLYRKGKTVRFRSWEDMYSIEGKTNKQGIRYRGGCVIIAGRKLELQPPKHGDSQRWYYEEAIKNKVCHVRIKRRPFGSGWEYYAELVMDGHSPKHHACRSGNVGIDIGPSTVAAVGDSEAVLRTLGFGLKEYDAGIHETGRRMDQSRRMANPGNYNPDGTVKKGRKTWVYTKGYWKKLFRLKTLYRRRRESLSQWQDRMANELLTLGNVFHVETMNFKALQAQAKESHPTGKTMEVARADGSVTEVEKMSRKKRFGKSLLNHAPAALIEKLGAKAASAGGSLQKVDTRAFKASQYDHAADRYVRHSLDERSKTVDGQPVQRDLYSAFLLKHSNKAGTAPKKRECRKDFPSFLKIHDACLKAVYRNNDHNANFGLDDFFKGKSHRFIRRKTSKNGKPAVKAVTT